MLTVDDIASCVGVEMEVLEPRSVYDDALVGVVIRGNRLICGYDTEALRELLLTVNSEWTEDEAAEWIAYNAIGRVALLEVLL